MTREDLFGLANTSLTSAVEVTTAEVVALLSVDRAAAARVLRELDLDLESIQAGIINLRNGLREALQQVESL